MRGSTATGQAPSTRRIAVGTPKSLEETAYGRRYIDPEPAKRYDLIVVGAGEAALAAAGEAARLGARTALVGRELLGPGGPAGRRVPAEALLRAARAIGDLRTASSLGLGGLEGAWFDYPTAYQHALATGRILAERQHPKRLRELGIDVFVGEARFTAPDVLALGNRALRFDKALLASAPGWSVPKVPGLAEVGYATPDTLVDFAALPARLAVIGGGPEGCELAQAFARFGATVTLVEEQERILGSEDADAAALVRRALVEDGVRVLEGFGLRKAELIAGARRLFLTEQESGSTRPLDVEAVLLALGRVPDVEGLGLERAGVGTDAQAARVDAHLRTDNPRIFAVGWAAAGWAECPGQAAPEQTHAHLAVTNALCLGRARWDALPTPRVVLTDPEIVHVGLRRRQAERQGIAVETFRTDFNALERALCDGEGEGLLKLHVERKSGRVVGATLVARHASEMADGLTLAVARGLRADELAGLPRPRPTQAGAPARATEAFVPRHLPLPVARLVDAFLRRLPRKR